MSHCKKNWARYDHKYISVVMLEYPFFLSDFNETCIFSTSFRKFLVYENSWKSIEWKPRFSTRKDGQRDRHDEANNRFSKFCEKRLKCYIKPSTKQTTITLQDTERQTDRQREREREMTETETLIANIKYRGRLINESFLELEDEREDVGNKRLGCQACCIKYQEIKRQMDAVQCTWHFGAISVSLYCVNCPPTKQGWLHAENSYKFETISIIPSNSKKRKLPRWKPNNRHCQIQFSYLQIIRIYGFENQAPN